MADPIIRGSFFDIQHVNPWNAQYWVDECRDWSEENWRALVADMHEIGIETIIAYQDLGGRGDDQGYGPAYPRIKRAAEAYRKIKPIHEKTGVELWTNCELFIHVPRPDGRWENLAGPIERIVYQLQTETEPVDYVICYQYQGIMNRHTKLVNIGHLSTQKLYDDYRRYLDNLSSQRP